MDLNTCIAILATGKRKGLPCGLKCPNNYCKRHSTDTVVRSTITHTSDIPDDTKTQVPDDDEVEDVEYEDADDVDEIEDVVEDDVVGDTLDDEIHTECDPIDLDDELDDDDIDVDDKCNKKTKSYTTLHVDTIILYDLHL